MTKVLLITEDLPSSGYGTGQRVKLWKDAIESIGECRVLHLVLPGSDPGPADYSAPMAFDYRADRLNWLWWQASFGYYRGLPRYNDLLRDIHSDFSFEVAVCSFFRTAPVAPLDIAPCILDVDALPWPDGSFSRSIWPLTKMAMLRRARRFSEVVVIAKRDGDVLASRGVQPRLLPGASSTVQATLDPQLPRGRNVLFVGPRNWRPNGEAMEALIRSGLPARLHEAGYTLRFVGQGTDGFPPMDGLSGGGFVDDIAKEYEQAAIVLSSTESGHGANIKLAEAIQYGSAVIASDYSARGYEGVLVPGEHLLTYTDASTLPDLIMGLLSDDAALRRYRANAATVARERLSKEALTTLIAGWIEKAATKGK